MIESSANVSYLSAFYKQRIAPAEVVQRETQGRRDFLETFIPQLHGLFQQRGVNALIEVVGSVAAGRAIETSDIDLVVSEAGTDDLTRVRTTGIIISAEDIDMKALPYKVDFWFDHPYGWLKSNKEEVV